MDSKRTENRFALPYTVLASACDHTARLGYVETFALCQDLATVHAAQLGLGVWDMTKRGLFWLTVKTKLRFYRRPRMMEELTLRTYPLVPEKFRSIREYAIEQDGQTLVQGKTEWAVLEQQTGKLFRTDQVFSPEIVPVAEPAFDEPFLRLRDDFSDGTLLGVHRVSSADIDLGRHMNNVAYLRALLSLFSTQELDAMPISQIELAFRSPCFEGNELRFYGRRVSDGLEFGAFTDAPKPVLLGKLTYTTE